MTKLFPMASAHRVMIGFDVRQAYPVLEAIALLILLIPRALL